MNEVDTQENTGASPTRTKIIKRYTNRKLYDTADSRYVTLEEIGEMVKQGVEVKIIDNRTREDLTSVTMAQIILEEEKKTSRMPLSVLKEIIRHPGESISEFIQKEVSPRVASIKENAENKLEKLLSREEGAQSPLAEVSKASTKLVEDWQKRIDERVKLGVENLLGSLPALGKDVQLLVQRIEELEKKVSEYEAKEKQGPKP